MLIRLTEWFTKKEYISLKHHNETVDGLREDWTRMKDLADACMSQRDLYAERHDARLAEFLPALAERGRRVLGNLKQSQPRVVQTDCDNVTEGQTILEPVTGGGCIGRVYVVDTLLDLQCLYLALAGEDTNNWKATPDVIIKGYAVICEEEIIRGQEGENPNG